MRRERKGWPAALVLVAILLPTTVPAGAGERIEIRGPARLDRPGATYVLQQDVVVEGTAFTVAADDVTLDLNGHVVVYDEGREVYVPNPGFEEGNGDVPSGWDLAEAPGARRAPVEKYWGSWELRVDMDLADRQVVRSAPVDLPADRELRAYGWVRGRSGNSAVLRVVDAGTGEVLGERSSAAINRGFALEIPLRLERERRVRLELELRGSGTMWCDEVDVRPAFRYGVASYDYRNEDIFPDLEDDALAGGRHLVIRNGTIRQGSGRSVRSPAIRAKGPGVVLEDLVLEVAGINTPVVDLVWGRDLAVRNCTLRSSSPAVFNRMSPVGLLDVSRTSGSLEVTGCTLEGGSQQGITLYRNEQDEGADGSILLRGNVIRNDARVTNGYALAMTGCRHFRVLDNTIEPTWGRGILLDTSGEGGSHHDGEIAGNRIVVRERPNHEYGAEALQAAGIRLRGYPPKGIFDVSIHDNVIRASAGPGTVSQANGITLTLRTEGESVRIEDNDVEVTVEGEDRSGYALLLEDTHTDGGLVVAGNVLAGNYGLVRFGDYDGEDTSGIVLEGNTLRRTGPERSDFHAVTYGYWKGTERGNTIRDARLEGGADLEDVLPVGSGEKELAVEWFLTVRVFDRDGRPIPGARVTFVDRDGAETVTTTGTDGRVRRPLRQYVRSGPSLADRHPHSPWRIVVEYAGARQERTVPLESSREEEFHLPVAAGEGPPVVRNLGRGDVH